MIGFEKDIIASSKNETTNIPTFSNFDFIDTDIIFREARKKIDFFIPEFVRYISGDRRKSKIYGKISRYYTEETLYINNVAQSSDISNHTYDYLIEDSCAIYRDLRVIILNEDMIIPSITGYDIITNTVNDNTIYTIFIQGEKVNAKMATSICLKLFDKIIINYLYTYGVPIFRSNYVLLDFDGINGFKVSRFIYNYFYELLYPFTNKIMTEKKDLPDIVYQLSKSNFEILSEDQLTEIYNQIVEYDGIDIELIVEYQASLEGKNLFNTDN